MSIAVAGLAALALLGVLIFYTLVARKNEVKNAFATIDAMLKKRFDLIPKLVASVKESPQFEASPLETVIAMRSPSGRDIAELQKLDSESATALKGIMAQAEAHLDIKSNQNFVQIQHSLQEVEDQLAAARRSYNAAVTNYNNALEMFPTSMVAKFLAYEPAELIAVPEAEHRNGSMAELFRA